MTLKEASEIIATYMMIKYPAENFYNSLDNLVPVWQKLAEETKLEWQGFMVNFFFSPKNDAISLSSNLDGNHPFYRMYPCSEDVNNVTSVQTSALLLTAKVVKQYLDKEYHKYKG